MYLEAAKTELAAQFAKSLRIAFGKFPLRALLEAADCNDDEAHEHFPAKWKPVCRRKCSKSIICAHSDRKTGIHFCGMRAARYHALSRFSSAFNSDRLRRRRALRPQ